jgi:hypothetical protein
MTAAEIAYAEQHAAAAAVLQQLQDALFNMPAPDAGTPINWEHVGSATEITRQLRETLAFVAGDSDA